MSQEVKSKPEESAALDQIEAELRRGFSSAAAGGDASILVSSL